MFCNPPNGRSIGAWTRKALTEPVTEILLLVPARTEAAWFQPLFDQSVLFIRGRLRFSGSVSNAPFPSALVYRGPRPDAFAEAFGDLGRIARCAPARQPGTLWPITA
ncbi:MAG TPA: hypothetical protein VFN78_12650 [Ktedonobacterales bacterium]|nr:hypothetical protein [Ktedonobacterales bacterium]